MEFHEWWHSVGRKTLEENNIKISLYTKVTAKVIYDNFVLNACGACKYNCGERIDCGLPSLTACPKEKI